MNPRVTTKESMSILCEPYTKMTDMVWLTKRFRLSPVTNPPMGFLCGKE